MFELTLENGDFVVFHNDPVRAVAGALAYALQLRTMERYRYLCDRCGMPMVERTYIGQGYRMLPFLECPLCKLQGMPQ